MHAPVVPRDALGVDDRTAADDLVYLNTLSSRLVLAQPALRLIHNLRVPIPHAKTHAPDRFEASHLVLDCRLRLLEVNAHQVELRELGFGRMCESRE